MASNSRKYNGGNNSEHVKITGNYRIKVYSSHHTMNALTTELTMR